MCFPLGPLCFSLRTLGILTFGTIITARELSPSLLSYTRCKQPDTNFKLFRWAQYSFATGLFAAISSLVGRLFISNSCITHFKSESSCRYFCVSSGSQSDVFVIHRTSIMSSLVSALEQCLNSKLQGRWDIASAFP